MKNFAISEEAAERIALDLLKVWRDDAEQDAGGKHPEDRAAARMRIAAIDVLLAYGGNEDGMNA